jgi:hypothetical protein
LYCYQEKSGLLQHHDISLYMSILKKVEINRILTKN